MTLAQLADQLFTSLSEELAFLNESGILPVKQLEGLTASVQTSLNHLKNQVLNHSFSDKANLLKYVAEQLFAAQINGSHSLKPKEEISPYDNCYFNLFGTLVDICDLLYDLYQTVTPDVTAVTDLLTAVKQIVPNEIWPNLKLPKAFISLQQKAISENRIAQEELMRKNGIDEKLIRIAAIPFERFIEPTETLFWQDFTWLRGYQARLNIMDWEDADCNSKSEALMSLLIGRNFNDDRFYIYCKKYIRHRTQKISSKRNRLLEYALCGKLVLEDTQAGIAPFAPRAHAISARLIKWIREEIDFIEQHEREIPVKKFEFKWNVETIAFFFKLLWDHKVFGKVSLEPFSEQIAANCSSIGKDEFQATTIFSRFYVKDVEVLQAVEKALSGMLEDVRRFL